MDGWADGPMGLPGERDDAESREGGMAVSAWLALA